MHHELNLTEIALVVVSALLCGLFFERLRQPAVLGYILAGVLLGPSALELVSNREAIQNLAELGVLMLLFLIGLELKLSTFKEVWAISLGTTAIQLVMSLGGVFVLGWFFALSTGLCVVMGCAIALSSTAVAIKMLERIQEKDTPTGRLAIGVLIAQDLAIVPLILWIKGLEGTVSPLLVMGKVALSLSLLGGVFWYLGREKALKVPYGVMLGNHRDLAPLMALVFCFGSAVIAGLSGLSAAYGAFLGGLILGNTPQRPYMIKITKPIQSVLMMVFFLSTGLLLDFHYIWDHLGKVLILLFLITIGKTALNVGILRLFKAPWEQAFLGGLVLSQMGEFAFLLTTEGLNARVINDDDGRLIISLAALSLTVSPFWMAAAQRLHDHGQNHATFDQVYPLVYGNAWHRARGHVYHLWQKIASIIQSRGFKKPLLKIESKDPLDDREKSDF